MPNSAGNLLNKINDSDKNQDDDMLKKVVRKEFSVQRADANHGDAKQIQSGLKHSASANYFRPNQSAGKKQSRFTLQRKSMPIQKSDSGLLSTQC